MFNGLLYMPGVYWSMIREDGDEWERYVDEDTSMTIDQRLSLPRTTSKMKSHVMIWERPDIVNRDARMLYYVGLPLHDMIHAFLIRYTCKCRACSETYLEDDRNGHLLFWQQIARDVENFGLRKLDIRVDMKRAQPMAEQWHCYNAVVEEKLCRIWALMYPNFQQVRLEQSDASDLIPF